MVDLGSVDLAPWQKAWPAEDRRAHVEKVKPRQFIGHIQVGLEKGPDGSNVLPISLKYIRENAITGDGVRYDIAAEIGQRIVQQFEHHVAVEYIDTHRSKKQFVASFDSQLFIPCWIEPQ